MFSFAGCKLQKKIFFIKNSFFIRCPFFDKMLNILSHLSVSKKYKNKKFFIYFYIYLNFIRKFVLRYSRTMDYIFFVRVSNLPRYINFIFGGGREVISFSRNIGSAFKIFVNKKKKRNLSVLLRRVISIVLFFTLYG